MPVPVYVPVPMNMYSQYVPTPTGIPLPVYWAHRFPRMQSLCDNSKSTNYSVNKCLLTTAHTHSVTTFSPLMWAVIWTIPLKNNSYRRANKKYIKCLHDYTKPKTNTLCIYASFDFMIKQYFPTCSPNLLDCEGISSALSSSDHPTDAKFGWVNHFKVLIIS